MERNRAFVDDSGLANFLKSIYFDDQIVVVLGHERLLRVVVKNYTTSVDELGRAMKKRTKPEKIEELRRRIDLTRSYIPKNFLAGFVEEGDGGSDVS